VNRERWVTLPQLSRETGVSESTLRKVHQNEPEVLPNRQDGKRLLFQQPACALALGERRERILRAQLERRSPTSPPSSLEEAVLRKAQADATRAELRVQRELGAVISVRDASQEGARFIDRLRAVVLAMPSRHQTELASELGVSIPAAGQALRRLAAATIDELRRDAGGAREPVEDDGDQERSAA